MIDFTAVGAEAVDLLRAYLQIDTTNPPGNEIAGARFLAAVLQRAGIESRTVESAPGRANLVARVRGDGSLGAIVLHHHIDVVYADRRFWTVAPFGGEIKDGFLYGRGAIDMKSTGILQLAAVLALKRAGARLTRDLVFLATADEEAGSAFGAQFFAHRQRAAMVRTTFAVNMLRASEKLNVIPPEAVADIDCRVLAGDDPGEIRDWVTRVVDDDHVRVEFVREPKAPNLSPPDTEMYKALVDTLARRAPGVVVAPEILVAFTDSWVFRRMGLAAYGWSPFILGDEEWRRVHGNDERISLENVRAGAVAAGAWSGRCSTGTRRRSASTGGWAPASGRSGSSRGSPGHHCAGSRAAVSLARPFRGPPFTKARDPRPRRRPSRGAWRACT